jgi:hypothetical protein
LELTIERNFTLSRRGFSGFRASSRTLFWNSNKLSSRLIYSSGDSRVRAGGAGEASVAGRGKVSEDKIVPCMVTPELSFGSAESNSVVEEDCIRSYFTLFQARMNAVSSNAISTSRPLPLLPKASAKHFRSDRALNRTIIEWTTIRSQP